MSQSARVALLTRWIATMRDELRDELLDGEPDLRELKAKMLCECERLLDLESVADFDALADVDAYSSQPLTTASVGKAFARPARSSVGAKNGKRNGKKEEKKDARAIYDAWPGPRPLSSVERKRVLQAWVDKGLTVVDSNRRAWMNEFDGPLPPRIPRR